MTEPSPVKVKEKKPPSDFEIARTILQRTHERKLPYILKRMGEDDDILFLCSEDEEGFSYGSSDITIALIEILDPELKDKIYSFLNKMYGFHTETEHQLVINIRDQISELAKNKGESFECETQTNDVGSAWVVRKDVRGNERVIKFSTAIESLYHFKAVKEWCNKYRPLLTTDDPNYLYYPYTHPSGENSTMMTLGRHENDKHPLVSLYPSGFRTVVTRGVDVVVDKSLESFPYPVQQEEMIVVSSTPDNPDPGVSCQIIHRLLADGWRMILVRPNSVFFPTLSTDISKLESRKK